MNYQEQVDVATLLARLYQIDNESKPDHWLWEQRVLTCDFPRLGEYITDSQVKDSLLGLSDRAGEGRRYSPR